MSDQVATSANASYNVDYPHPTQQRITLFLLAVVAIVSLGVLTDQGLRVIRGLQSYNACVAQTQGDCRLPLSPEGGWLILIPVILLLVQSFALRGARLITSPQGI